MTEIIVDEITETRLDKFLVQAIDESRSKIQKLIEEGKILVNGEEVKSNYMIKEKDIITIEEITTSDINVVPEKMDLDIVHEDDDVMVVNKPSGMVVHPAPGHFSGTLVNGLMAYCNKLSNVNGEVRPGIVHRIDKDTSGLLMVAKNNKAHISLSKQLENKTTVRKYIALVHGVINNDTGTINAPIGRDKKDRKKMAVTNDNSKEAVTNFKVLERYKKATLIECSLETGRTHQIRVHLSYIDFPVINDPLYSFKKKIDDTGQMLHARLLGFNHPTTNEYMEFEVGYPDEFTRILKLFKDED